MSSLYSCSAVENLISRYVAKGGEYAEVVPGTLGYGTTILYGDGLKTIIVQETYINAWSSGHKIRMYNKCPAKYAKMLEKYFTHFAELE